MSPRNRLDMESGILRAALTRVSPQNTRVRLLVAIPAVIVLLLCLMAGVYFWIADAYLSTYTGDRSDPMQSFSNYWLFFLGLFIVGGGCIGYILAWSLTQPIQDIIRLSERVAGGDLSSKVAINRQDEMGELGSSFNYMVESLNHFIETRNRYILESFSGGLIVTDLNGTITAVNSAAEKLLDLRSDNVTGKSIRQVFDNPDFADFLRYHERVIWKQETLVDKRIVLNVRGAAQPVTVNFTAMRDTSGNVFGVIINLRDLVEMERFYQHMRNTDRLATMGTFASGLAHEIKNPLGAIKGTAQLLLEDLGPNHHSQEYLHVILKEVNRLDALIREVQAYSQPAAEKVPADMNRIVEEILNLAGADPRLLEKSYRMEKDIQPLPRVVLSKNQFRQALFNIVINAIEAVPQGGLVKVSTKYDATANLPILITVRNEGPPVAPDLLTRIFEPFFTTKASGTGLGLSIARQVAANHGGKLTVDCEDGMVAFTMHLPSEATPPGMKNDNLF